MATEEIVALERLLERMRALYSEMNAYHGGVSLLHLEAAVASLESHLRRQPTCLDHPAPTSRRQTN